MLAPVPTLPLVGSWPAPGESRATRRKLLPNIARGQLNGPAKVDRVPEYTAEHVVRIERIKRLQADGHTLLEIGRILRGPAGRSPRWNRRRHGGSMRSPTPSSCG
jgi:hypothetical protein